MLKLISGRVTGVAKQRKVDDSLTPDTVDQRIDWAVVMLLPEYKVGQQNSFRVYDPTTGNSAVSVKVSQASQAGTVWVVYSISKSNGAEEYRLLVRTTGPRLMLKEEFPNGAVTELVDWQP